MRHQLDDFDCGPTAIANAFEVHHRRIGLHGLRALTHCDPDGADEDDLLRALLAYGCPVDVHESDTPRLARLWLVDSVQQGRPVLLCVDRWSHWVTVIGLVGSDLVIVDPARETGGTFVVGFKALARRWEAARRVRRRAARFYGIGVGKPLW